MKKKSRKSSSSASLKKAIKKEIDSMHNATADFVEVCIDIAKTHPKGLKRIKKHVDNVVNNMSDLDKMYKKLVR
ncbi:MAG: hypothetical protein QF568_02025 [Flavobacteriales bacterium]|jgi:hypothetical protein|nr:hypothetical protein [Flavobacteriales bacterium]|tara:strand:+ start:1537 stop:1758 length:222 start_codon:yes stop_codon:yes gene_type:complete